MPVNKGLLSIVENNPNFSNQGLENAVDNLKIGWVQAGFDLDEAISNNTVLTQSQKNDLKDDINNVAHINLGRTLGDLVRHTASIVDASIMPLAQDGTQTETFLGILQNVDAVQSLIPTLYGEPASSKSRTVNDHVGTLNSMFSTTTDSSAPVFTSLLESINFINTANLATETALETAYNNCKSFIDSVVADSTDFQQTLDGFGTAIATAHTNLNNALATEPYLTHRNNLAAQREKINVQVSLENSNLTSLSNYLDTLSEYISYAGLAGDSDLASVIANVAQDTNWQTYFKDYAINRSYLNPLYTTDEDRNAVIDQVLADSGLPDVTDPTDFEKVANKARRDSRIDTANFDRLTPEQIIVKSCTQLGITTANRTINSLSSNLLRNMNKHDRDLIAQRFDRNKDADTLS